MDYLKFCLCVNQESSMFYSRRKMKLEVFAPILYVYILNGFLSGRV